MIDNKLACPADQVKSNGQHEEELIDNCNLLLKAEGGKKIDPAVVWWL